MPMKPPVRKAVLATHLAFSVGWIGAVVVYLVVGLAAQTSSDPGTIRAAWITMELAGWFAVVPLALGSLVTGVVIALGTTWGLFRHYWVIFSLVGTIVATVVLLAHMPSVTDSADKARRAQADELQAMGGDLLHPGLGLVLLLGIQVLNVYKPRGLTPHGWRKRQEQKQES